MKVCDECSGLGIIGMNICDICYGEGYIEDLKSAKRKSKAINDQKMDFDDVEYTVSYSKGVTNKRRTNHR